jgi:hypothetical protein
MARLNDEKMKAAFAPYLEPGEQVTHVAFGVKQPNVLVMLLTGVIFSVLLTKNYVIGLTSRRFLVLQIKSMSNPAVKAAMRYDLAALGKAKVKTSTGPLFTHIRIDEPTQPFVAKFHRAYSSTNRPSAMAIATAISA